MIEHKLLLLLRPAPGLIPEIARLRDTSGLARKPVSDTMLHSTVGVAGAHNRSPRELIARIVERLSTGSLPCCQLLFDTIVGGSKNALLKPSETLPGFDVLQFRLASLLAETLADRGLDTGWLCKHIKPHVTLGYGGPQAPAESIDPISWKAEEILLVESLVGLSRHQICGRWQLQDAPSIRASATGEIL